MQRSEDGIIHDQYNFEVCYRNPRPISYKELVIPLASTLEFGA